MKKVVPILFTLLILGSVSVWAADEFPKAEVFGGFSVLSVSNSDIGTDRWNALGFQAAVAGNITKSFGIVGDFGGQYKDSAHVYEYMGGPRFTARMKKASVFAHALFGGATIGGGTDSVSENGFAMGFGGGVDVNANKHFAIRLIQFDWVPVHMSGTWFNNQVRFGFGIVFK